MKQKNNNAALVALAILLMLFMVTSILNFSIVNGSQNTLPSNPKGDFFTKWLNGFH